MYKSDDICLVSCRAFASLPSHSPAVICIAIFFSAVLFRSRWNSRWIVPLDDQLIHLDIVHTIRILNAKEKRRKKKTKEKDLSNSLVCSQIRLWK